MLIATWPRAGGASECGCRTVLARSIETSANDLQTSAFLQALSTRRRRESPPVG
jgi:hypothetical protein